MKSDIARPLNARYSECQGDNGSSDNIGGLLSKYD